MGKTMPARLPIALRIHFITAIAVLGLVLLAALGATSLARTLQADRAQLLRSMVDAAIAIAAAQEAEQRAGRASPEAAQQAAIAAIRAIRYQGNEYVWINDRTPRMV